MVGQIIYRQEKGREKPCWKTVCTLPVLTISLFEQPGLSPKRLDKRLERLERIFLDAGVNRVILSSQFPHTERLRYVRAISVVPFYRAAADILVLKLLERRGILPRQSRVALTAQRPCPELIQTANSLCRSVREVRIDLPGGEGERLARSLQRQFGVPVVPPGVPVDVTLSFGGGAGDLQLWEEEFSLSGLRLKADGVEPPAEIEQQVLALLWERGRLKRDDLQVTDAL